MPTASRFRGELAAAAAASSVPVGVWGNACAAALALCGWCFSIAGTALGRDVRWSRLLARWSLGSGIGHG
ncbi:MAG: hypothetical protein HQ526_10670 [Actinobacteria bacterium]|nr:hypothetical protein [Actinomycetota bacterium]